MSRLKYLEVVQYWYHTFVTTTLGLVLTCRVTCRLTRRTVVGSRESVLTQGHVILKGEYRHQILL